MVNITLSMDDDLLKAGREYAKAHDISFNVLVRRLIEQTVRPAQVYRGVRLLNPFEKPEL